MKAATREVHQFSCSSFTCINPSPFTNYTGQTGVLGQGLKDGVGVGLRQIYSKTWFACQVARFFSGVWYYAVDISQLPWKHLIFFIHWSQKYSFAFSDGVQMDQTDHHLRGFFLIHFSYQILFYHDLDHLSD